MTEREFQAYKEKAIAQDVLSVENRIRHAFNQGVECGRKLAQPQDGDLISRRALLKDMAENYIFTGFAELLQDFTDIVTKQPSISQPQIASDCVGRKYIVHEVEKSQDTIPIKAIKGAIDEMQTLVLIEYDDDMTAEKAVETAVKQTRKWCIGVVRKHTGVNE